MNEYKNNENLGEKQHQVYQQKIKEERLKDERLKNKTNKPKNRNAHSKIENILIIFLIFIIGGCLANSINKNNTDDKNSMIVESQPSPSATANESIVPAETTIPTETSETVVVPESTISPKMNDNNSYLYKFGGRGRQLYSGQDLDYTGTYGYVVIGSSQEIDLDDGSTYESKEPWQVPVYLKDGSNYSENGFINHKTPAYVIEQLDGRFLGSNKVYNFLHIQTIEDKKEYYIYIDNFIFEDYWNYKNIPMASKVGYFVAEYNPESGNLPIDDLGEIINVTEKQHILVIAPQYKDGTFDFTYYVKGLFWDNGVEKNAFFFGNDLNIIY